MCADHASADLYHRLRPASTIPTVRKAASPGVPTRLNVLAFGSNTTSSWTRPARLPATNALAFDPAPVWTITVPLLSPTPLSAIVTLVVPVAEPPMIRRSDAPVARLVSSARTALPDPT